MPARRGGDQTMNYLSAAAEPWVQPMVGASTTIPTTPKGVEHIETKSSI
jgi:hypothetical protein